MSLKRSQKSPTCCGKATSGSPVCRVENKNIGRKDKKQPTLTPNLGDLDEVPDNHGEPNGPQNRIPGISRVPRMYLDFQSSSNPIGGKLLECGVSMVIFDFRYTQNGCKFIVGGKSIGPAVMETDHPDWCTSYGLEGQVLEVAIKSKNSDPIQIMAQSD